MRHIIHVTTTTFLEYRDDESPRAWIRDLIIFNDGSNISREYPNTVDPRNVGWDNLKKIDLNEQAGT